MFLRMLIFVVTLGSQLTSPLFAGTERGSQLFQESGGSVGIPGVAGPAGAPGIAAAAGAAGIQGIPGIPGAPGLLDFSDFYALQGTDNGTIAPGSAIQFPHTGSTTGAIFATGSTTFVLPTIGTYLVQFQVDVTQPGQLQLSLNSIPLPETVVGRATGTTQIIGMSLVTTATSGSVLQVINPSGNNPLGLTIPFDDGGTQSISAHLVIIRIQ